MSKNKLVSFLNSYTNYFVIPSTKETLTIKPITTGQMKNLLTYEGKEDVFLIETILDELMEGCVVEEDFKIENLTLQDRFMLLIEIRKISKGDVYETHIKCPKCDLVAPQFINLNELKVIEYNDNVDKRIKINDNFVIHVDYITRKDQKEAIKLVKKRKLSEKHEQIQIMTVMYAMSMKKFETSEGILENQSLTDKIELLDGLDDKGYKKFIKWYTDNDFGVEFEYLLKCNNEECDFEEKVRIPLTDFFV
jgi:thiol-disulfide isomerase/thioredoxin